MLSFFRADCDGGLRAVRCRLQHGRCGGNEEPTRSVCSSTESTAGLTLLQSSGKQLEDKNLM